MTRPAKRKDKSKQKPVFKVDSPFTGIQWPAISVQQQEVILDMLISLLSPIGQYRHDHVVPSKGKRKKRRRDELKAQRPEPPEIQQHILVGINTVTRHLENCAKFRTMSSGVQSPNSTQSRSNNSDDIQAHSRRRVAAIFLAEPPSNIIYAHLPVLCRFASSNDPYSTHRTRLVPFGSSAESKIATTLRIPRATAVAILEDAPRSQALVDHVRQLVQEVRVPWLDEAQAGRYRNLNIETVEPG